MGHQPETCSADRAELTIAEKPPCKVHPLFTVDGASGPLHPTGTVSGLGDHPCLLKLSKEEGERIGHQGTKPSKCPVSWGHQEQGHLLALENGPESRLLCFTEILAATHRQLVARDTQNPDGSLTLF